MFLQKMGQDQKEYVKGDDELKSTTDDLIAKGYYIKDVSEWSKSQNRYTKMMRDYYKLYNSRQSGKNYIEMMRRA